MWDDHSPQNATFDPDILLEQIGGPYLLRQRIVTRLGMIFAKEVEVLSVDFSPEHTALWTKTHGSLPMVEFFGGGTRSNIIYRYPDLLPRSVFHIFIGRHVRFRSKTQQDSMAW